MTSFVVDLFAVIVISAQNLCAYKCAHEGLTLKIIQTKQNYIIKTAKNKI